MDVLVETTDPAWLDKTLTDLPGVVAQVVGGPNGPFRQTEGYYVVRVFTGIDAFKFMVENQGYCKIFKILDALV